MNNDPLANTLSNITNTENLGKTEVTLHDNNKTIKKILELMKEATYIGETKEDKDKVLHVNLLGKINKTNVIKPRFSVKLDQYEQFEKRFLLAKDFGIILVSTSKGIMTHVQAKEQKLGGKLLAYCY